MSHGPLCRGFCTFMHAGLGVLLATIAAAQAHGFRGTVLDQTGGVITSARVTAVPEGSTQTMATITDQRGEFTLPLPAGRYTITIGGDGFLDASETIVVVGPPAPPRQFTLRVAGIQDTVSVNAPSGYGAGVSRSATKTATPLLDIPQSITVVTKELMRDQLMSSVADVVRYIPGITTHQGENNRDQIIVRGNNSTADFFVNGVRDDVQYYRDIYNLDRIEALKGPNAMIFGRGGAGGVINRVTKEAGFQAVREIALQGGTYGDRRFTTDLDQPLSKTVAVRLNGMFEHSDSFRNGVDLERYGVSPSLTFSPSDRTTVKVGYEFLDDARVADRGISSYRGAPANVDVSTYYGDWTNSYVHARVHLASSTIEHRRNHLVVRNHTLFGAYDRGYQNYVPGAVTANMSQVALSAYNSATERHNVFNQTDLTYSASTGGLRHTVLGGVEIGRQLTDNVRNTGYFNNTATSILVPFANPSVATPVFFRQSATDADNHLTASVAAAYVQDQVELSRHVQLLAGLRFERFDLDYHNNRNQDTLGRADDLVSPRAGVVVKPMASLSLYGSYSVSYLPGSGDQFSSLTVITEQLKPEKFANYEGGMKWDLVPTLSLTTAVYRLNRTNTRSTDPNDATRIVQTGSQRTNGYELGLNGRLTSAWKVAGGYAYQDAYVTSATAAARAGAQVAQVPRHTLSFWNHYQVRPRVAAGLGIIQRTKMFAAIDNTVTLPGYTRVDAAGYYTVNKDVRLQVNVENLFDVRYYVNADNNTNISPGFPRAIRFGLTARF